MPRMKETTPARAVMGIVFSADRTTILLIQRCDVPVWVLPGGGVERTESPEEAVVRELEEETGFIVRVTRLIGEYTPINRLTRHTFFYECQIVAGVATTSAESRAVRFFALQALPKLIPPPYPEWIETACRHLPPVYQPLRGITYRLLAWHCLRHPILVLRFFLARMGCPVNW